MKRISILLVMCLLHVFGGRLLALSAAPYFISGNISDESLNENEKYNFIGSFTNDSSKDVCSFTIVFYVFDEDGGCPLIQRNNVVIKIDEFIKAGKTSSFNKNLDKYFYAAAQGNYETEYLYVSRIVYSDGSEWSDPFGLEVF